MARRRRRCRAAARRRATPRAPASSTTPMTRPTTAPPIDSMKPSTSSCRTTRARPLPSAWRIAISRRRAEPRASSRFARFRHATSSTSTDISISSADSVAGPESVSGPRADAEARHQPDRQRLVLVGGWIIALHLPRDAVERALRRRCREPRLQRAGDVQRVVATIGEAGRALLEHLVDDGVVAAEREPPLRRHERHRAAEPARRDADHCERAPVRADRAADEAGRQVVAPPHRVRRDRHRRARARTLLVHGERAAGGEPHAERLEVVRRHDRRECLRRRVALANADGRERVRQSARRTTPLRSRRST